MRLSRLLREREDLAVTFARFEAERRPRAERIVARARRNSNQKRELTRVSAWIRDQMLKVLLPLNVASQDWMYAYNPCAITPQFERPPRQDRQAA